MEPNIDGLRHIQPQVYRDDRGYFTELFNQAISEYPFPLKIAQINHSRSEPRVLRGLHYQVPKGQGKLVTAISGKIWDVAVDLRKESPTYGKWESVLLSSDLGNMFWIPPEFAHGFCVVGDQPAEVVYMVTEPYDPQGDRGIRYNDPTLKISWPVYRPIVSEKDSKLPWFKDYES